MPPGSWPRSRGVGYRPDIRQVRRPDGVDHPPELGPVTSKPRGPACHARGRCADGRGQREFISRDEASSPTASLYAIILTALIDAIEDALKTPVQAAVKREDEQEFARLNGQNLMFCEDASRRLQHRLVQMPIFEDFWVRVNHYE